MKEQKNLDRLFQEKFRDFEFSPPERIWSHVEKNIYYKPRSRKRQSWVLFGGVAVGLALMIVFNNPFVASSIFSIDKQTSEVDQNAGLKTGNTEDRNLSSVETNNNSALSNLNAAGFDTLENKNSAITLSPNVSNFPPFDKVFSANGAKNQDVALTNADRNSKISERNQWADVAQNENTTLAAQQKNDKGWSVSTVAAPVFLSTFGKDNSGIDAQMNDNEKQGKISSAYGIQVAYQFNKRFSIQSGVHLVDFAYRTFDVNVSPALSSRMSNIQYEGDMKLVKLNTRATMPREINNTKMEVSETGDLTQVYGYIEIPLEAKYRLNADNDLGINIIGGFSTLLLNKNEVYVETSEFTNKLGEASNLNSLNFSGNLGVELEYRVYKNVNFNLVPMFKIQTQTLDNTNAFKPYSVGLYSGLNLRF